MVLWAPSLPRPCLCRDLCLERGAQTRAQNSPGQPDKIWGCGGTGLQSPESPKRLSQRPRWSYPTPVSLLGDSLRGRHSALGPTAPHLLTPTVRDGPAVSSDLGLGNFLGPQDERETFHCYWPVILETPAQLLRGPLGSPTNGHKAWSLALPLGIPQPSSTACAARQRAWRRALRPGRPAGWLQ